MESSEIIQSVVHYLGYHSDELKGAMPDANYFFAGGRTTGERSCADSKLVYGLAVDVLADLMENDEFFGFYIDRDVKNVNFSGNAGIRFLGDGDEISG